MPLRHSGGSTTRRTAPQNRVGPGAVLASHHPLADLSSTASGYPHIYPRPGITQPLGGTLEQPFLPMGGLSTYSSPLRLCSFGGGVLDIKWGRYRR